MVAPSAGGLTDLVRDGHNGLLWEPSRPTALRGHIARLASQPDLRATLARNARPSVVTRGWDLVGDQLLGHYDRIISDRAGSRPLRSVA